MKLLSHAMLGVMAMVLLVYAVPLMAADVPPLAGTQWVLTGLTDRALVTNTTVTLNFAHGTVFGSDGCNRYSGRYTASESTLRVSAQLATTQLACIPEVEEQSRVFMAALSSARSYRIGGGKLELLAAEGKVRATLAAQSTSLAGSNWRVTGINNGKQAVVSLLPESSVSMMFGPDGRASGSAGCNNYSAPYTSGDATLSFGQAAVTRKMCARPQGIMEQEQQFLRALTTVATTRMEGDHLEFRTSDGAIALLLARER